MLRVEAKHLEKGLTFDGGSRALVLGEVKALAKILEEWK